VNPAFTTSLKAVIFAARLSSVSGIGVSDILALLDNRQCRECAGLDLALSV
jgi:hypothetical protein